jgi:hypothetical protein
MAMQNYRYIYYMKKCVPKPKNISVDVHYLVVKKEASIRNISIDEFIKRFVTVAEFDNFGGVHYTFKESTVTFLSNSLD